MSIRVKIYAGVRYMQKWFVFVSCLIFFSCNSEKTISIESASIISDTTNDYSSIDLLLERISNDTIALFNYLSLAKSARDSYAEMESYRQLGLYYLNNYAFLRTIEYHILYLHAAEKYNDPLKEARALNMLAYDYRETCILDKSSEYYFKTLSILDQYPEGKNKEMKSVKAKTLNGIGNIYLEINQPDEAFTYFKEALQIEIENKNISGQAKNLKEIGTSFKERMQYDSAHWYYNRALKLYINENSLLEMALCFESIGNLYMAEGDWESASAYIKRAYNSLEKTSDRLNRSHICFSIGNLYMKKGNWRDAAPFLQEGLKIAEELQLPNQLEKAYMLQSELHQRQGENLEALLAYSKSVAYGNAFRNGQSISRIVAHKLAHTSLASQLETTEKRKAKEIDTMLLLLLTFSGFAIILIQRYRLKKRICKIESSFYMEKIKSDFYTNISDEFKTPVAIITGLIERLRNNVNNNHINKISTDLDILSRQSKNLGLLADEILSAANINRHGINDRMVHGNMITYLSYLFESFSPLTESKKINYSFLSDIGELHMDYQPEILRFIFYNLIGGIIQYCRENDTISVGLSREKENKNIVIIVTDTSEYYLTHHHRNAFYHTKPNTERAGLLLINQLVGKLNGSINVEYKSPKGTVFKISLPICNEEVHNDKQPIIIQNSIVEDNGGEDNSTGKPIPTKENPSLLIVESNKDIIYYLSSLLKSSYQIFTVDNGEKAVRDAIEIMPDIILANIVLPGINGCDLCKEIKSSDSTSHIPVILLSTYSSKEERIEGIRCGADAFLSRPVHDEELLAVINQSLEVRRQISNKYALATVNTGNGQEDKKVKNDALADFIKHITDLIYKEITKTDGIIEIIADKTCLSTSQLNRKIKAATGMTTSNYILKIKLNKAAQLLARTQKPIGEIAMSCGFNDFAYFSRTFKKEFNMTPTSFQRLPHSVN